MLVGLSVQKLPFRHLAFYLCAAIGITLMGLTGCGQKTGNQADVKTTKQPATHSIKVPDGSAEELISFIIELSQKKPNVTSQAEFDAYKADLEWAITEACDRIIGQEADDASLGKAVRLRLNLAIASALEPKMVPSEADASTAALLKLINQLRDDKRQVVSAIAKEYALTGRIVSLPTLSETDRRQLVDDTIQQVSESKGSPQSLQDVGLLAEILIKEKSIAEATLVSQRLDESTIGMGGQAKSLALRIHGMVNRANLPGTKLEIEGTKLDGTDLDWESYRGKVVLVDFWATWCGPCVESLPHVKAIYEKYHSKGFEVIGISLDHERRSLEKFLDRTKLPWVQLFRDPDSKPGSNMHPMAMKYGVSGIPAAFLVDRNGIVVSSDAFGPDLEKSIQNLLK